MANIILVDYDEMTHKMNKAINRATELHDEMMIALIYDIIRAKRGTIKWIINHDETEFDFA